MDSLSTAVKKMDEDLSSVEAYKKAKEHLGGLTPEEMQTYIKMREMKVDQEAYQKMMAAKRKTFDTWSVWGGSGRQKFNFDLWDPSQQGNQAKAEELKLHARKLAKRIIDGSGINVLLAGKAGTGKTAMSLAMVEALRGYSDKTVMFVSTIALSDKIHNFYDKQVQEQVAYTKKLMKEVDVLVLDDFGSEAGGMGNTDKSASEPLQKFFFEVADARQAKDEFGKRTKTNIVTTNQKITGGNNSLEHSYHEKIISRLIAKKEANQLIFGGMEDLRE